MFPIAQQDAAGYERVFGFNMVAEVMLAIIVVVRGRGWG